MRTWKDNADEFKALEIQGKDFRLCILVACSVERHVNQYDVAPSIEGAKASATRFGERANTREMRVLRHLDTWEAMAEMGKVPHALTLTPDHVNNVFDDSDDIWAEFNMSQAAEEFRKYWSVTIAAPNERGIRFYGDCVAEDEELLESLNERVPFDYVRSALVQIEYQLTVVNQWMPDVHDPGEWAVYKSRLDQIVATVMDMVNAAT